MADIPLVQALRAVPLLSDLKDSDLQWLADHMEDVRVEAGETFINPGDPADRMSIILEGEIEGRAKDAPVYIAKAGEITGKLPHSRMEKFPRSVRAVTNVRMARLHQDHFLAMMQNIPELEVRLVRLMADRIREFTTSEIQQSKLAALGKLSAGLAHELNNPASAASRAADSLREKLLDLRRLDCALASSSMTCEQRAKVVSIEAKALDHARSCTGLDALTRSDREEELGSQLSSMGVRSAWDLAPELMDGGFTIEILQEIRAAADGVFSEVLARIALLLSVDKLAEEIRDSMGRISSLVKSIKEYSYMDTAPEREIDIHNDIENTLRILNSKINKAGVNVERDYDKSMPKICANGSELNQVWTNLIDNALDAMENTLAGEKLLRIHTSLRLDYAHIEILDTGSGIPEEVRQKIFEPFFTTKGQGNGTGLGLDAVLRIIRRHNGEIRVESKPGRTCFRVILPVQGRSQAGSTPSR